MPEPKMVYYDADGKRVPEGDPRSVVQYLEDDQLRPDSPERKRGIPPGLSFTNIVAGSPDVTQQSESGDVQEVAPVDTDASKSELQARAAELGLPVSGNKAELAERIAEAEKAQAEAPVDKAQHSPAETK